MGGRRRRRTWLVGVSVLPLYESIEERRREILRESLLQSWRRTQQMMGESRRATIAKSRKTLNRTGLREASASVSPELEVSSPPTLLAACARRAITSSPVTGSATST